MADQELDRLLEKFFRDQINPAEQDILARKIEALEEDDELHLVMENMWLTFQPKTSLNQDKADSILRSIMEKAAILESQHKVVSIKRRIARSWAIAASVIIIISLVGYLFLPLFHDKESVVVLPAAKDVSPPASGHAIIKLAGGETVYLDSVSNGELAMQGQIRLIKKADGKIEYEGVSAGKLPQMIFNTLINPRGSRVIDLTMSDGSRVWLNAGSSLTYPIAFLGDERKVTITGEAYFEVAHDDNMPFKVMKDNMELTVLGTKFNVNAFDDERNIKVTLLEGSVKIQSSESRSSVVLKPGQQAGLAMGQFSINNEPDIEEVMAWKNGLFIYRGDEIETIMMQVSRWYDVQVEFRDKIDEKFFAEIDRHTNVSTLLNILQKTKAVNFEIEGKKIIVRK